MDAALPMFPLGSVLFPFMPLPLRVFEERYLAMLAQILPDDPPEFGVVLIERGQEVGGGEHRFTTGTVAQVREFDTAEGFIVLVAQGERRIRVLEWQPDAPYPVASVEVLPEITWDPTLADLRDRAEVVVRVALAAFAEGAGADLGQARWPADIELSDDPVAGLWQLAAIAPIGPLDQVALLRSETAEQLLTGVLDAVNGSFDTEWPD